MPREERNVMKTTTGVVLAAFLAAFLFGAPVCAGGVDTFGLMGTPACPNVAIATTNSSALLSTVFDAANGGTAVNWGKVRGVLIQALNNAAVISVGVAAANGASQVGFTLSVNQTVRFAGGDTAQHLYIVSKTDDAASRLIVLVEY